MQVLHQLALCVKKCVDKSLSHSDLKPDNVLVRANGEVVLCDFGCACAFQGHPRPGLVVGGDFGGRVRVWDRKQLYLHPTARTSEVTALADVFSLLVMATEVLYGRSSDVFRIFRDTGKFDCTTANYPHHRAVHRALGKTFQEFAVAGINCDKLPKLDRFITLCRKALEKMHSPLVQLPMKNVTQRRAQDMDHGSNSQRPAKRLLL